MKHLAIIFALLITGSTLMADTPYYGFIVDSTNTYTLVKAVKKINVNRKDPSAEAVPSHPIEEKDRTLYFLSVSGAQYSAGFYALDHAVIDTKVAEIKTTASDIDTWDGDVRASTEALLDFINEVRADPKLGLPPKTKNDLKDKIKDKDPTKPKKK